MLPRLIPPLHLLVPALWPGGFCVFQRRGIVCPSAPLSPSLGADGILLVADMIGHILMECRSWLPLLLCVGRSRVNISQHVTLERYFEITYKIGSFLSPTLKARLLAPVIQRSSVLGPCSVLEQDTEPQNSLQGSIYGVRMCMIG